MYITPASHKTISSSTMKKCFPAFIRRERISAAGLLAVTLVSILF